MSKPHWNQLTPDEHSELLTSLPTAETAEQLLAFLKEKVVLTPEEEADFGARR